MVVHNSPHCTVLSINGKERSIELCYCRVLLLFADEAVKFSCLFFSLLCRCQPEMDGSDPHHISRALIAESSSSLIHSLTLH